MGSHDFKRVEDMSSVWGKRTDGTFHLETDNRSLPEDPLTVNQVTTVQAQSWMIPLLLLSLLLLLLLLLLLS